MAITISKLMKLISFLVSRPVCSFIGLSLIKLLVPGLLIPFWFEDVERIKTELHLSSHNILPGTYAEIDKIINHASMLLLVMVIVDVIFIFAFVVLIAIEARREICLRRALIKQMEATQQAERKSMNKSLAFARASHDVRASLAAITGLIEICREMVPRGSELWTNLMQTEECTKDLSGILNSTLDTSRIEAGKMQLEEEEFDLQQLLENVVDLHYNVGMKKGVDVILDFHDDSLTKYSYVKGDRGKLKQILDNLLNNAVKFTSEGHVVVRVWAQKPSFEKKILASNWDTAMNCMSCLFFQNDRACSDLEIKKCDPNCMEFVFEVSDTGKGIPKEKQKYVFENYVQVKEATIGQEGTGLGLGIVQSLVRLMGGEIGIVDKDRGEKGTCFRFNTYFTMCESQAYGNAREDDLESNSGYISSNSIQRSESRIYSPKVEGSHIVLFIQNDERRKVIQKFMESLGIKVSVVQEHGELSFTLRRVKQKSVLSFHNSSGKSDVNARSDLSMPTSRNSSTKSKDIPLSAMDGTDNVHPVTRRTNARGTSNFILIVIDTSAASFLEISRVVAEFRRDFRDICSRVVWIDKPGTRSISFQDLDEPTDVIISKPLHGSRLYEVVRLLPEFGVMQPIPQKIQGDGKYNAGKLPSDPSTSASAANMKFKSRSSPAQKLPRAGKDIDGLGSERPLSGKKVLVVEDNSIQQTVAKFIFSQLGAEVDLCETGAKAIKLVSEGLSDRRKCGSSSTQPYDYILMDCKMEEMNGFEATRLIREEEANYGVHIPIIALTAHTQEEVTESIKQAGMDHYLPKPLKREQLLEAIDILNRRVR